MAEVEQSRAPAAAVDETVASFQPEIEPAQVTGAGYIDLLGERDAIGASFAQRTMRNRVVSSIYEWLWRPMVSRAFFGLRGPMAAKERGITMGMLDVSAGDRVLDVGCGPGTYTRHLARASGDGLVVGFDASETMLRAAVRRTAEENVSYVRGDACALPFGKEAFDAVCCSGTLHLIDDPMRALDEMVRVLASGGRLTLLATCRRNRGRRGRAPKGIRVFGRDELTGALRERGLIDVNQRVIGRGQFVTACKPKG